MNSPRGLLGQSTVDASHIELETPGTPSTTLLDFFRDTHPNFVAQYSFLVNPHTAAMIRAKRNADNLLKNPPSWLLTWRFLAMQRAYCGTEVLEFLMANIIPRDVINYNEEGRLPLFLIVVGTIIAITTTRNLRYIVVSAYLPSLQDVLSFRYRVVTRG